MGEAGLFRELLGRVSEGILTVDESGAVAFANVAGADVFGYAPAELVGESLSALVPDCPVDPQCERNDVEALGRRKDGSAVPITVSFHEVHRDDRRLVACLVRDDGERRRVPTEPRASAESYRHLLDTAPNAAIVADAETDEIVEANTAATDLLGTSRRDLVGRYRTDLHPPEGSDRDRGVSAAHAAGDGALPEGADGYVVHDDGHWIPVEVSARVTELDGTTVVRTTFRDVRERRRRERELALAREERTRLNRINRVVRRTNRALLDAETRSEIANAVCERLVDAEPYVFAWMGSVNRPGERVVPETWAGDAEGYLDAVTIPLSDDAAAGPTARAVRTRDVQTVQDLETDEAFAPWRGPALERGYRSSAAIPVVFGDRLFGVLCLYADTPAAFDAAEREVLAELGESVGHAMNALEREEALMSDCVLEVDLRSESIVRGVPTAVEEGGTVTFDRLIPTTEDRYLQYVTVTGVEADRFADLVLGHPAYEDARCIREGDGEYVFELHARDPPTSSLVTTYCGRITDVVVEGSEVRITAELPVQTDVRQLLETLRERVPDVELVSQRTVPRRSLTPDGVRLSLEDDLTERQRTTIETAYYAGYFNWPRDSTAEEVADLLGVSSPTVHKHLRAAEQKVFRTILE